MEALDSQILVFTRQPFRSEGVFVLGITFCEDFFILGISFCFVAALLTALSDLSGFYFITADENATALIATSILRQVYDYNAFESL